MFTVICFHVRNLFPSNILFNDEKQHNNSNIKDATTHHKVIKCVDKSTLNH